MNILIRENVRAQCYAEGQRNDGDVLEKEHVSVILNWTRENYGEDTLKILITLDLKEETDEYYNCN